MPETVLQQFVDRATADVMTDELLPPEATNREMARKTWLALRHGSNAAQLVIDWAYALDELDVDELGIERFAEWSTASRRTVYRRVDDFRALFPDHHTPNALARQVLAVARRRGERPNVWLKLNLA